MVDAPSGKSLPEGIGMGLGSTVPDGQLSQEQDSAHVTGNSSNHPWTK